MGERDPIVNSGPPRAAEAIVAILLPPACREEVIGDLHERYQSRLQYAADLLRAVPLVILSRIRRTADPQLVLTQVMALYVSFSGAAWLRGGTLLREQWGLVRLAIPVAMILLGLILDDAYAVPGTRSALSLIRGPLVGIGLALASQELLSRGNPDLALPRWIAYYGCAMSFALSSALRFLFPPVTSQPLSTNAPLLWLKRTGGSVEIPARVVRAIKAAGLLLILAIAILWIAEHLLTRAGGA
jgi:hypothetical protein